MESIATKTEPKKSDDKLVGSTIQLITNAQVRYEGILVEVNKAERVMKLKNIRSYGTEGRRGGQNEVEPSDQEIAVAVFKVDLIKNFDIIKKPEEVAVKPKTLQEEDAAIVSASTTQSKEDYKTKK